jgi:SAM-dependent methyltransferase
VDLPPSYDALTFLAPLSEQRADALVTWLAAGLAGGGTVLDVGCGWGELLLRVAAAAPSAHATGVDLDDAALDEARRRAVRRGLDERVELVAGDGSKTGPVAVDALIAVGVTQVWGPPVEDGEPLAYADALRAIRRRVRRGARVLYADGIWSHTPTAEAAAPLSGRLDEFVSLPVLAEIAAANGFGLVGVSEATLDEWDAFESGFNAGRATWLSTHDPDHPDAEEVRTRAARQRAAYLRGYRGVLGMAYLQLLAL